MKTILSVVGVNSMRRFLLVAFPLLCTSLLFSSCMHLGMATLGSEKTEEHSSAATAFEKEVVDRGIKTNVSLPPLNVGKEALCTFTLVDTATNLPVRGAMIEGRVRYLGLGAGQDVPEQRDSMNMEVPQVSSDSSHDLGSAQEQSPGLYRLSFVPKRAGNTAMTFTIVTAGESTQDHAIRIEAMRTVAGGAHEMGGGMMGMSGSSMFFSVGMVLMATMMVVAWALRGGMHW